MRLRFFALGLGLGAFLLASCDAGDDTVAPNTNKDAGSSGGDATVDGTVDVSTDSTTDPNSLCAKYGGYQGVANIAQAISNTAFSDCKIGHFFALDSTDEAHLVACMSRQLGEWMGCGGVTYAGSIDPQGLPCRTMTEAHKDINPQIRQADLDAYMIDVNAAFRAAGVTNDDLALILPKLNTVAGDTVQSADDGLSNSTCPGADGGLEGGEGGAEGGTEGGIGDAADEGG
jgi:hypothetical protein